MLLRIFILVTLLSSVSNAADPATIQDWSKEISQKIDSEVADLDGIYKYLHRNPELSMKEFRTAAKMADELKKLGFDVTEKIGQTGVVGIFKNGQGPTVLVRADMDALPVIEQTGLAYASQVRVRDAVGREVGVMHACGHDMHLTCFVGTARTLVSMKDRWKGTLVFIAQPGEETGMGARLMLADGLYTKFPKPDFAFALHCDPTLEHGAIHYTEGFAMANVDTVEITAKGRGGHGAFPHTTIDPVVLAAKMVMDLQLIRSRELNPLEPGVVTIGSIHGGTKSNIIPNEVQLQLTVRTTGDKNRKQVLDSVQRIAKAAAMSMRAPEPVINISPDEFTPALINDAKLVRKTVAVFKEAFGEGKVRERQPMMGGEDFARYGLGGDLPIFLFFLGTVDPNRISESKVEGSKPLPSMHSDMYAPVPEPSMRTGIKAMSLAVLNQLGK
jgi:amidohydrolase